MRWGGLAFGTMSNVPACPLGSVRKLVMIRNSALFLTLPLVVAPGFARAPQPLVIAEDGRSDYRIVVAETAAPATRHAAVD